MGNHGRTTRKPPDGTPCGYCFEKLATGYDHLIPVSYRLDNKDSNLYPSCKRCNNLLGNRMFKSFEEKREYVRCRLKTKSSDAALRAMQHLIREETSTPEILLIEVPVGKLERKPPATKYKYTKKHVFVCRECGEVFVANNTTFKYCSEKCKRQRTLRKCKNETQEKRKMEMELITTDLSRLKDAPIEVADAAVTAILRDAEALQCNIFAKLAVALRIVNDRKIYERHVDQYGEPFKSMESWIKAMYPETWRYAKDAYSAAMAMPEVPIEDIADMKRCNAVMLADPGISPMVRSDPEIIEAAKTETEKEFREHINSKHGQALEGTETLKFTLSDSNAKMAKLILAEYAVQWNEPTPSGQLMGILVDWQSGGHSEETE